MPTSTVTDYHREQCKIIKVVAENFREGAGAEPNTVSVWLETKGGSQMMFGGLVLNDKDMINSFLAQLMAVFGVSRVDDLIGKQAIALRSWGGFQEDIEGLENETAGRRMTVRSYRRAMNFAAPSRLEQKTAEIKQRIEALKRDLKNAEERLKKVKENYVEWN